MICKNCDNEVNENAAFCRSCGYNLKEALDNTQEALIDNENITTDSNKSIVIDSNDNVFKRGIRYLCNKKKFDIIALFIIIVIIAIGVPAFRSNKLNDDVIAFKQSFNNKDYGTAQQIYDKDKDNKNFNQQILNYISGKLLETKEKYINKNILVSEAKLIIENIAKYKSTDSNNILEYIQNLEQSRYYFDLACQEFKQKKFYNAIETFSKVIKSDENYKNSQEQISVALPEMKKEKLLEAEKQYQEKDYANAVYSIIDAMKYINDDKELLAKEKFYTIEKEKAELAEKDRKQAEEKRKKAEEEAKEKLVKLNEKKQVALNKVKEISLQGDQIIQLEQNLKRNGNEYFAYRRITQNGEEGDMRFYVDINTLDIFVMYSDNTFMSYDQYIEQAAAPSNRDLNEQQAIAIIRDYFNYTNVVYTYDHDSQIDGEDFYVIHVYENHPTHTATLGWYGVQKSSGRIYDDVLCEYIN